MNTTLLRRRIAVIGGGISGLAAAHKLSELAPDIEIILLEANSRLGGVLHTKQQDGYLIEEGGDNFITTVPWATNLCQRINLDEQLIGTNTEHRRAFIVHLGRLREVPAGLVIMAPSRIWPILTTRILSWPAKLRIACEFFIRRKQTTENEDESIASFVTRRFGCEMYERLVQPLIAGIYTADPKNLSLKSTLPRFLQMEKEHGSLIQAMLRQSKSTGKALKAGSGARYSQFVTLQNGMSSLIETLASQLPHVDIQLQSPVDELIQKDKNRWDLTIGGKKPRTVTVDGVILATPTYRSAQLLCNADPVLAQDLEEIEYGSCALATLAYDRDQISHELNGFGFVVPFVEQREILSASLASIKYAGRAPDGKVLIRVFMGGALQSHLLKHNDQKLLDIAHHELVDLLGVRGRPVMGIIKRHIRAMPQYHLGHKLLIKRIEARAAQMPGLALAGNALHGVGIPDCINTAELAAKKLFTQMNTGAQSVEASR